jgi:hypothetical protein
MKGIEGRGIEKLRVPSLAELTRLCQELGIEPIR